MISSFGIVKGGIAAIFGIDGQQPSSFVIGEATFNDSENDKGATEKQLPHRRRSYGPDVVRRSSMIPVDVFVVALLPLLFVALGLLGLILVLWIKNRVLWKRIAELEADIKTIHNNFGVRLDSLEANVKAIQEQGP